MFDKLTWNQKAAGICFLLTKLFGIFSAVCIMASFGEPSLRPYAQFNLGTTITFLFLTLIFLLAFKKKEPTKHCSCHECG